MASPSAGDDEEEPEVIEEPDQELVDEEEETADEARLSLAADGATERSRWLSHSGLRRRGRSPILSELESEGSDPDESEESEDIVSDTEEELDEEGGGDRAQVEATTAGSAGPNPSNPIVDALKATLMKGIEEALYYTSDDYTPFVPLTLGQVEGGDAGDISQIRSAYTVDFLGVHGTAQDLAGGQILHLENCKLQVWTKVCMHEQHRYFFCRGPTGKVRQPAGVAASARSLQRHHSLSYAWLTGGGARGARCSWTPGLSQGAGGR
eukprot:scaffold1869_cov493-Prasinococcus_capsulatus_cf.AAC.8